LPADQSSRLDRTPLPEAAIREQMGRLLCSSQLAHSERLKRLLRFLVEEALAGRGALLKESRLGLDVFDRPPQSYDPAADPIVRVQAGRLRARLRSYYESHGSNDPILIDVPTGSYVPSFRSRADDVRTERGGRGSPKAATPPRLAILPFVNMSPDPNSEYFSDGLTEELINLLARDGRLRLIARTSSFQFKGAARDVREIGRQLGAARVLEGSVRKAGDRVRVTAQLINVDDGCHLWSERYEGEVNDIFAIQDEIASSIQRALQTHLGRSESAPHRSGRTEGLEAHNHYLQGRFLWNQRTGRGFEAAINHFFEAIRLAPDFARAYSGLADCHLMLGLSATKAPEDCMPEARAAAQRALALDPGLAEAHASLAAVKNCYEWDRAGAEAHYQSSRALDPSYATSRHWYGVFALATAGRLDDAAVQLESAIQLDPLSQPIIADLGLLHALRLDLEAAVDQCRRALELDPNFHRPYWFTGLCHAWCGDPAAGAEALERGLDLCAGAAFRSRLMSALGSATRAGGRAVGRRGCSTSSCAWPAAHTCPRSTSPRSTPAGGTPRPRFAASTRPSRRATATPSSSRCGPRSVGCVPSHASTASSHASTGVRNLTVTVTGAALRRAAFSRQEVGR
jgi:serine/threonine-protein kinase